MLGTEQKRWKRKEANSPRVPELYPNRAHFNRWDRNGVQSAADVTQVHSAFGSVLPHPALH